MFIQDAPVLAEVDFPKDIGPAIRVARSSTLPRAARIHRSPPHPYHDVTYDTIDGPLDLKPKSWQEAAGTADSGYLPSSGASSMNPSPEQPGATHNHFVFNSNPDMEGESKLDHTYAIPPDCQIESVYVHPSDIETTTTTLDQSYSNPNEKDAEICETRFDAAATVVTTSIDTQTLSTSHQPSKVMHITSEKGLVYAVPTKGHVVRNSQEIEEDLPTTFKPKTRSRQFNDGIPDGPPINSSTLKISNTASPIYLPLSDRSILKPPEDIKAEQIAELRKLPSILRTKLELERKLRGEDEEDESPANSPGDSPVLPRRISIPEILQNMPAPPPMSTHPGLTEQPTAPTERAVKKKSSFKLKKRSSKKEERKKSIPENEIPPDDRPTSAVRRRPSMGVATPMVPTAEGQESEFHAVFKSIRKRGSEDLDTATGNDILVPMTPVPIPTPSTSVNSKGKYTRASSITVLAGYSSQPSSLQQVIPGLKATLPQDPHAQGMVPLELRRASTPVISRAVQKVPIEAANTAPMNTKRLTKKRINFRKRKSEAVLS